jgi:peroxiredoxin
MHTLIKFLAIATAALTVTPALALKPGDRVDNFRLVDHSGASHQLYYFSDMKAVVLLTQANQCAASKAAIAQVKQLRDQYQAQGVQFFLLNSSESRDAVAKAASEQGIDLPVLIDDTQLIGESLAATQAGEALLINPKNWTLAYRGESKSLGAALDAVVKQSAVKTAQTPVKGCAVKLPELARRAEHAKISYSQTIAPMLQESCVACHRAGGIGPWAMTNYEIVKGFAPMIREVVRTERMPPWHADPHYGAFKNNRAMTKDQAKTLVHWIEAGAPRGQGPDPLATTHKDWPEWPAGQPDLVLNVPAFDVPATGVVPYQNQVVQNPLDRDVWLRAVDFAPGNRSVLHHVIVTILPKGSNNRLGGTYLAGYVPGAAAIKFPTDTGILLPAGSAINFQMHYTTSGKTATDQTRFGVYFAKETPKYPLRNTVLLDPRLRIPANTKAHPLSASRTFDRDILIYSLTPHSHFRGRASNFVATYPDGRQEVLLSVPYYDFNWQTAYELSEPKLLPAGSKLTHTTVYDNSVQNPANPDPNIEVRWGEQSWEEMLYGNVRFRYLDETVTEQKTAQVTP